MSLPSDRLALLDAIKESKGDAWVVKPPSSNQGKGITITADAGALELIATRKSAQANSAVETSSTDVVSSETDAADAAVSLPSPAQPRALAPISKSYEIVQRYIARPMLLPQQRKFDLRVFLLWAKTEPAVVYWHPGYARVCLDEWQPIEAGATEVNKFAHLTNLAVAKVGGRAALYYDGFKMQMFYACDALNHFAEASKLQRCKRIVRCIFRCDVSVS